MQNEDILPYEAIDTSSVDGNKNIKILPPSAESIRLAGESDKRMQELEVAGWTKDKAAQHHPPGYLEAQKHIHAMGHLADRALDSLEAMDAGSTIDHQTKSE